MNNWTNPKSNWKYEKLENIANITLGQSPSSEYYNSQKLGLPLIQGNADIEGRKSKPNIYSTQITKICEVDDILISVRAPVGTVAKSVHKAVIGRGVAAIRPITSVEFIYQYLLSIENAWSKVSQGSTFPAINGYELKNLVVPYPPQKERDTIAEILSTWDEAINKVSFNIENEKRKKKSIVSKIYRGQVSESNTNREDFKRLKHFLIEVSLRNNAAVDNVLSVSNSKGFIPQDEQFGHEVASKDRSNYKVVSQGEFAYNPSRVNVGSIDLLTTHESGILSPMYVVFKCNNDLNNRYLYHFLKSDLFLKIIPKYTQGSVRDSLSFDGLCSMKLYLPTLKEQLVYAQALDAIDDYIKKLEQLLELYRLQKRGLMQQLLTGKIRVIVN